MPGEIGCPGKAGLVGVIDSSGQSRQQRSVSMAAALAVAALILTAQMATRSVGRCAGCRDLRPFILVGMPERAPIRGGIGTQPQ